jgi:nucleotide-binding universal stress UspA family protein
MPDTPLHQLPVLVRPCVTDRILVGVDGTEQSLEACRQAVRLAADGALAVVAVLNLGEAALTGPRAVRTAAELQREARIALERAEEVAGPGAESRLLLGHAAQCLIRELVRWNATLVALGTHGHSRASEIFLGGTAGEILYSAPCSVLIARRPPAGEAFPRIVVAGIDGSSQSDLALAEARALADRFGASLRVVAALGGKRLDVRQVSAKSADAELIEGHPVDVLVEASQDADLLVIGNRGLHGLAALGSVSERVAHRALSSVLVVKFPQV